MSPWVRSRRKRLFDLVVAVPVVVVTFPLVVLLVVAATIDTRKAGLFRQRRVGKDGQLFTVLKIRSMRPSRDDSTVTVQGDARITRLGAVLRAYKLDELPQFWNVARGTMSLVGPRPDVPGYADQLTAPESVVLMMRPGITGPATLHFRNEEELLAAHDDPVEFNDTILWPQKVALNAAYAETGKLRHDLRMLQLTLRSDSGHLERLLAEMSAQRVLQQ